jgi:hypothetical protein
VSPCQRQKSLNQANNADQNKYQNMKIETALDILYGNAVKSSTLDFTPNLEEFQPLKAKKIQESLESIIATCEALNREIEAIKYTLETK